MSYKYSVAISFLSADERVARELRDRLQPQVSLPFFFYPDFQDEIAGREFGPSLTEVFEKESRVVAVLYRPGWGDRQGTLVERRAIDRRRQKGNEEFLLPISLERDCRHFWSDDLISFDLTKYDLDQAIRAVLRLLREHEQQHPSGDHHENSCRPILRLRPLASELWQELRKRFVTAPGVFRGYFGGADVAEDSKRWQSKGGESVASEQLPKRPYYHTYWGYEAALRLEPAWVNLWAPVTVQAVEGHFGPDRWLRVVRNYDFAKGPRSPANIAETVRHTARAAELLDLLSPGHRLVSEIAWQLIREARLLQASDGGWREFRGCECQSDLWPTIYVYRFLKKLLLSEASHMPFERDVFVKQTEPLLAVSEAYLRSHWQSRQWSLEGQVAWHEGAASVLAEIGPFS